MKKKPKKIIIIAASVLVVAIILWLVFRKKSTKRLLDKLGLSADLMAMMEGKVAEVEAYAAAHPYGSNDWSRQGIQAKADEIGVSYEQMVLIEAAYSLYDNGKIGYDMYNAIEMGIRSL